MKKKLEKTFQIIIRNKKIILLQIQKNHHIGGMSCGSQNPNPFTS